MLVNSHVQADIRRPGRRRLHSGSNTALAKSMLAAQPRRRRLLSGRFAHRSSRPIGRCGDREGLRGPRIRLRSGAGCYWGKFLAVERRRRRVLASMSQRLPCASLSLSSPVPIGIREAEPTRTLLPLSQLAHANFSCLSSSPEWPLPTHATLHTYLCSPHECGPSFSLVLSVTSSVACTRRSSLIPPCSIGHGCRTSAIAVSPGFFGHAPSAGCTLEYTVPVTQIPRYRIDRFTCYDRHEPCNGHDIQQWHRYDQC